MHSVAINLSMECERFDFLSTPVVGVSLHHLDMDVGCVHTYCLNYSDIVQHVKLVTLTHSM